MKRFLFLLIFGFTIVWGGHPRVPVPKNLHSASSHFFIENKGQWHSDVLYLCRLGGVDVWITKYGINYTFYKVTTSPAAFTHRNPSDLHDKFASEEQIRTFLSGHRVLLKYKNSNLEPVHQGYQEVQGYYNYFLGNDPSQYVSLVRRYREVVIKEVYDGIDVRYYFDRGSLRFDYIVHPGADPSQIKFELEGQYDTYLKDGDLCFTICFGEVILGGLRAYQGGREIPVQFEKYGNAWGIQIGDYDRSRAFLIDPLLYSTYLGGNGEDKGYALARDSSGNVYLTGYTTSLDYDTTPGVFQTTSGGNKDVFITKLNSSGTGLIYSTYLGGGDDEQGYGIAVDNNGNVFVVGVTNSVDFPVTSGAFQTTHGDGGAFNDAFVVKLNASGTTLVYSTYLGGNENDYGYGIAIDGMGNAYITGGTYSTQFPVTSGAFQTTLQGLSDVFVAKLNGTGTGLVYSTYLGGSNYDQGYGIAVDGNGNAFVSGVTFSMDFDTTSGAYQTGLGGGSDAFVTKINATGTGLIYSTYLGGSMNDRGYGIVVDSSGNAYLTGYTLSSDFDTTFGAYQTMNQGGSDVFVTKLNSTGTALVYSTYLGGSGNDGAYSIAIDGNGDVYITGETSSTDFDTTAGAFQTIKEGIGGSDLFVTKLNSAGTTLLYSTYLGGGSSDLGYGIVVDQNGNACITGYTASGDYDTTSGAFQTTREGIYDAFVTSLGIPPVVSVEVPQTLIPTFSVYPNPNHGNFVIQSREPSEFELLNLTGKVLRIYSTKGIRIEVKEKLPSGIYFIREKRNGVTKTIIVKD